MGTSEQMSDLEKDLEKARNRIAALETALEHRDDRIKSLMDTTKRYADDRDEARRRRKDLEVRADTLYSKMVEYKQLAEAKEMEVSALEKKINVTDSGALFAGKRTTLAGDVVKAEERAEKLARELARAKEDLRKALSESASRAATLNREIAKLRTDNAGLRNTINGWSMPEEEEEEDIPHDTTLALDSAKRLVLGDRAKDYGDPADHYDALAAIWQAYLGDEVDLDARDVVAMLIQMKTVRDRFRRKPDNAVDLAGYAQILSWVGDPRAEDD